MHDEVNVRRSSVADHGNGGARVDGLKVEEATIVSVILTTEGGRLGGDRSGFFGERIRRNTGICAGIVTLVLSVGQPTRGLLRNNGGRRRNE